LPIVVCVGDNRTLSGEVAMLAQEGRTVSSEDVWMEASALRATRVSRHALLLGTDGRSSANGAVRVARLLVERDRAHLHVVGVVDGLPPASEGAYRPAGEAESAYVVEVRARIDEQLFVLGLPAEVSDIEIVVGRPDAAMGVIAKREHACLIIVGRSHRSWLGRVLGLSTALGAARHASVAVLAVDPRTKALPRVAVVGTDFGQASIAAGRATLECLGAKGVLHLAHVRQVVPAIGPGALSADAAYEVELADRVSSVAAAINAPADQRVVEHVLVGNPAHRLLELAGRQSADLIAVGIGGDHRLGAYAMGTVAARILAAGQRSVLLAA
jgi:nucleotide-binding universal stress UspA family protein